MNDEGFDVSDDVEHQELSKSSAGGFAGIGFTTDILPSERVVLVFNGHPLCSATSGILRDKSSHPLLSRSDASSKAAGNVISTCRGLEEYDRWVGNA